jgi:cobalt-precorrin 5A hydrolase
MMHLSGDLFAAPVLERAGLVAGIGLRGRADMDEVAALIETCLELLGSPRAELLALTTIEDKAGHAAVVGVVGRLGVPIIALPRERLAPVVPNPSARAAALTGMASVAEAAALTFGPLILEKQRSANVTCALARYTPATRSGRSRASIAPATLATSSAGP